MASQTCLVPRGSALTHRSVAAAHVADRGCDEAEAVKRVQQGDSSFFELIYSLHKRRVFSICLRITKDVAAAEELTQDAFIQAYRKIATFRAESKFSTWLHRLTVNTVLMHLRKKQLAEVSLEDIEPEFDSPPPRQFGEQDRVLGSVADRVLLDRAIAKLPPGYRLVFVLHDIEGYAHNEIADFLGCTIGNSKSQLHKARLRVRKLLLDKVAYVGNGPSQCPTSI
jgi:RNA polymerase sigma-70 factor, ECF subfamily